MQGTCCLVSGTLAGAQRTHSSWKRTELDSGSGNKTVRSPFDLCQILQGFETGKISLCQTVPSVCDLPFHLDFQWKSPCCLHQKVQSGHKLVSAVPWSGNATSPDLSVHCFFWGFSLYVSLALAGVWQRVRTEGSLGRQYAEEHWRIFFLFIYRWLCHSALNHECIK